LQGGYTCIGLASNESPGQITRLLSLRHRLHSLFARHTSP
jgi:hypothetical protein